MNDENGAVAGEGSKGPSALIVAPAAVLGTLAVVAGGFFAMGGPELLQVNAATGPETEEVEEARPAKVEPLDPKKVLEMEPFVVSLRDGDGSTRGARLRFVVVIEGIDPKEDPAAVFRLRSEILLAAHDIGLDTLRGPEGIEALSQAIMLRAEENLHKTLYGVLITDYILL